jgi:hypothetical protein
MLLRLIRKDLFLVRELQRGGQLVPQGSAGIAMGSGDENVGRAVLPNKAHSFMWLNLSLDGNSNGVGDALYQHRLETADGKPSRWTCQPDPDQLAGLNHDRIGRDGAQHPSQVFLKQAAEVRDQSGDQQQLYRGSYAVRVQKLIENPEMDYQQKPEHTSQNQLNNAAGVELVW